MARILVVDDDPGTIETFALILRLSGYGVETAATAQEAMARVRGRCTDLLLTDLRLPDGSGVDLLRWIRNRDMQIPAILMTAFGTIPSAVEATRLGAVDYLEKPLFDDVLIAAVERALATTVPDASPTEATLHPAARWMGLVHRALSAESDPRTLQEWGQLDGIARATVEKRCAATKVGSKASLDFARVLRALIHARRAGCALELLLDADPRTLRRLLTFAGIPVDTLPGDLPTPAHFMDIQRFIREPLLLDQLRRALAREDLLD